MDAPEDEIIIDYDEFIKHCPASAFDFYAAGIFIANPGKNIIIRRTIPKSWRHGVITFDETNKPPSGGSSGE